MNPDHDEIQVTVLDWEGATETARAIREEVFVSEQQVPMELEYDGRDPECIHVLARAAHGQHVGTARMTPRGHIGRMAVRRPWRGHGVGTAMLQALVEHARKAGISHPYLHAQVHAQGFYERQGFESVGEIFMDAGIPHRKMILRQ
jgi:predicted GNAT family N-acyltransferase